MCSSKCFAVLDRFIEAERSSAASLTNRRFKTAPRHRRGPSEASLTIAHGEARIPLSECLVQSHKVTPNRVSMRSPRGSVILESLFVVP
ncbi:hypothetical protein PMIN04_009739 [Paraphaeosphaeria minitans]